MTGPDFTDRGSPDSPPVSSAPQAAGGVSRRIEPRRFAWVDAFTYKVFGGNPAVVVPLDSWPDSKWLQRVANEMNQSDTAFVVANGAGFDLRWFTPVTEIDLCGHATLAAAFAIWHFGLAPAGKQIEFTTRSGVLTAEPNGGWIELDFPIVPCEPCAPPHGLLEALGLYGGDSWRPLVKYFGRNRFDYIVEVADEATLRSMSPDFGALARVECRGVIATSISNDQRFDFLSRFFAPRAGIDEDPVTGSAHCCLAHYWGAKFGKSELTGQQISSRRGVVQMRIVGPRVKLGGQAVLVAEGTLYA
ncbi:MAG TPA: PhzF family phenazine biosynthesis protein [Pirellulaceae bacterium]|nr:PhzF family phenazine biosynthesis protein [Pirellulaceae bacterium]